MPQLHPIALFVPTTSRLERSQSKNILGPKPFIDLISTSKDYPSVRNSIQSLIQKAHYHSLAEGHFWYRIINKQGCTEGVLTTVALPTNKNHITTHEAVLDQRVQLFSNYLTQVGYQAEPVLLMHENTIAARQMAQMITKRPADLQYDLNEEQHLLWSLQTTESDRIENLAQETPYFHLADGHHRYASTLKVGIENGVTPLLFSFIVATDQVQNHAFIWAIKNPFVAKQALKNIPPESICHKGMATIKIKAKKKNICCHVTNSSPISNYILDYLLGLTSYQKQDLKTLIDYHAPGTLDPERAKDYSMIIEYQPLALGEIITLAKCKKILPPKSTYILPKLPTGLFFTSLGQGQIK